MKTSLNSVERPKGGLHIKNNSKLGFPEMKSDKGKSIILGKENRGTSKLDASTKGNK